MERRPRLLKPVVLVIVGAMLTLALMMAVGVLTHAGV